jgi:hypothetical protein
MRAIFPEFGLPYFLAHIYTLMLAKCKVPLHLNELSRNRTIGSPYSQHVVLRTSTWKPAAAIVQDPCASSSKKEAYTRWYSTFPICRVGQNLIYTVYIRHFWQENHQNIRPYTVYIYGSGQPYLSVIPFNFCAMESG